MLGANFCRVNLVAGYNSDKYHVIAIYLKFSGIDLTTIFILLKIDVNPSQYLTEEKISDPK